LDDGIYFAAESGAISYPEEGNEACFEVEDRSFWFRYRNACIAEMVRNFPPEGKGPIFDVGGGNGFVAKGLMDAGWDVDLCFRAWRKGWRCIFEPASRVLHREGGSWKTMKESRIDLKSLRNSMLFQWCNLPMQEGRWRRRWSVAKITMNGLFRLQIRWVITYFLSICEKLRLQGIHKTAPITINNLSNLNSRIAKEISH
jgi:hypothetical protein